MVPVVLVARCAEHGFAQCAGCEVRLVEMVTVEDYEVLRAAAQALLGLLACGDGAALAVAAAAVERLVG